MLGELASFEASAMQYPINAVIIDLKALFEAVVFSIYEVFVLLCISKFFRGGCFLSWVVCLSWSLRLVVVPLLVCSLSLLSLLFSHSWRIDEICPIHKA